MFAALVAVPEPMSVTALPGVATSPVSDERVAGDVRVADRAGPVLDVDALGLGRRLITLLVIVTAPVRFGVAVRLSSKVMLFSSDASPAPVIAAVGEAEAVDLRAVDAAVAGVLQVHVPERRAVVLVERDAVPVVFWIVAAGVVAALRRAAGAGDGQPAGRAGVVEIDAVRRAVGGDRLERGRADVGVGDVERGAGVGGDRVAGAADGRACRCCRR